MLEQQLHDIRNGKVRCATCASNLDANDFASTSSQLSSVSRFYLWLLERNKTFFFYRIAKNTFAHAALYIVVRLLLVDIVQRRQVNSCSVQKGRSNAIITAETGDLRVQLDTLRSEVSELRHQLSSQREQYNLAQNGWEREKEKVPLPPYQHYESTIARHARYPRLTQSSQYCGALV